MFYYHGTSSLQPLSQSDFYCTVRKQAYNIQEIRPTYQVITMVGRKNSPLTLSNHLQSRLRERRLFAMTNRDWGDREGKKKREWDQVQQTGQNRRERRLKPVSSFVFFIIFVSQWQPMKCHLLHFEWPNDLCDCIWWWFITISLLLVFYF